ncbi:MAG TPA: hypothetical protein PKK12_02625 [Candidatus Aminicenantes bacterium]|nr:hypothetical protein [Candidatus Aminicenantes bacterium]
MNPVIERAERRQEVRDAARQWAAGKHIDAATRSLIEAAYPDDRHRFTGTFRVVAFGAAAFAAVSSFALLLLAARPREGRGAGLLALGFAVVLVATTEYLRGPLRWLHAGAETATALLAGLAGQFGLLLLLFGDSFGDGKDFLRVLAGLGVVLFAALVWRYGMASAAAIAMGYLGLLLTQFPAARWSWILAALLLGALAFRGQEEARLAPSLRLACSVVLGMALAGLYLAVNLFGWDRQLFESGGWAPLPLRAVFIAATALLPLAVLFWGVACRSRLLLSCGLLLAAASLVTVRQYWHLAPTWALLTAGGALLIALALGVRRWLAGGPAGERGGFTAQPLRGEEGGGLAETAVALVIVPPQPAPDTRGEFAGEGGRSGGAGASDTW